MSTKVHISASHRDYNRNLDKNYQIFVMLFTFSEQKEVLYTWKADSKKWVNFAFLPLIKQADPSIYCVFCSYSKD